MAGLPVDSSPSPPQRASATTRHADVGDINQHYIVPEITGIKRFSRKARKLTHSSLQQYQGWEASGNRKPYHEYIHQLVLAGWDNLRELDAYMNTDIEDQDLVVSVLDIVDSYELVRRQDIHDGIVLEQFLKDEGNRSGVRVRLYMAEQRGDLAAGVVEAFGSALSLDPRFFGWSIRGKYGVAPLAPSQRHRAPFMSVGFGVPLVKTASRTDAENFRVSVYIHHNEGESGWTGIIIFNSHTKISLSHRTLIHPPRFGNNEIPPPDPPEPKSFREVFIESFEDLEIDQATASPFYAIHYLLRLNCYCWSQVIASIRDEDRRINGISDTSVSHVEEIKKSLAVVKRGGSLGWRGRDDERARESREALEEDFQHLVEQTDLLWQTRDKMASITIRKSEARRTALVNSFTYMYVSPPTPLSTCRSYVSPNSPPLRFSFAPISLISGIYGMNVSQISGTSQNPGIWQFFVAVVAMNVLMVFVFAASNWLVVQWRHGRKAGFGEAFGFAVGHVDGKKWKIG
ncbi:hypothetical protein FGG08_004490 [Glutinoglossum americanum]|uniref:Uncharacterized protein n=1 Tax=Glutinoglossum americanum TaxID=1670608 RepID=A0A9P8IBD3_9PEZI|nr:hypothetical protein FGG08_004490 [Glutinoglossum americanum]